jgi:hypothetical protein
VEIGMLLSTTEFYVRMWTAMNLSYCSVQMVGFFFSNGVEYLGSLLIGIRDRDNSSSYLWCQKML